MEINATTHQSNYGGIHMNTEGGASNINRPAFDAWRRTYWRSRDLILNKGGEAK